MSPSFRRRFWAECIFALLSGALTGATFFRPDWIEFVFEVDPDSGDGSLEWTATALLSCLTVFFTLLARSESRRPRASSQSA